MKRPTRRQIVIGVIAAAVLAAVVFAFLPESRLVDTAAVTRGPLRVTVEEEGRTEIVDRYVVTSPVVAYARRITLEAGDIVNSGDVLVQLEPPRAAILDPRTQAQANAAVRSARARVGDAAIAAERASADRARYETLFEAGAITVQEVEQARAAAAHAGAALESARAELAAAEVSAHATPSVGLPVPSVLRAPAAGQVLVVHHTSEGAVNPGQPLLEIGNTNGIEVRADMLSEDAVRIAPGARVEVDDWGGSGALDAAVTRIEPEAITKISALGVEEQRVPVRAAITSPASLWAGLGSGYRVLARFILWEEPDVLQVPAAALFRTGDGWSAFVVEGGRARLRAVRIGQQGGLATQVLEGLAEGDVVVVHPPNDLGDGARVDARDVNSH